MGGGETFCDDEVCCDDEAGPYDADCYSSDGDPIVDIVGAGAPSLIGGGDATTDDVMFGIENHDNVPGAPDLRLFGHSFTVNSGAAAAGFDSDASSAKSSDGMDRLDCNKEGDQCLMYGCHPNAIAGGAGPSNLAESSSDDDDFEDTDLMIDNISDLLKSCFRKNMAVGRHKAGGRHAHKRRRTERRSQSPDCKKATNRSNLAWLSDIIKQIPGDKKSVIERYGFSCCLYFDCSGVPRYFSQWIADHVQIASTDIILDTGCIHLSVQSFSEVTGLRNSGSIVRGDCVGTKEAFVSFLGLDEFPTIRTLGELLLKNALSDDQFFVCFMAVYLSSFLCPNSSTFPSTKYLSSLLVPAKVRDYNWALFGFNWFITSVKKYLRDKPKLMSSKSNLTLGGCNYYPAVYYLDFVDFGSRSPVGCFPRIKVWKRDMIKEFSRLDIKDGHEYGRRNLKELSNTCYVLRTSDGGSTSGPCPFNVSLETLFKDSLSTNVLNDICGMFEQFASTTDPLVSSRTGELVISVLSRVKAASESLDGSQFSDSNTNNHADGSDSGVPADNPHPSHSDKVVIGDSTMEKAHNSESTLVVDDPDAVPDLNDAPISDAPTVVVNSDIAGSVTHIPNDEDLHKCADGIDDSSSNCSPTAWHGQTRNQHTSDAQKELSAVRAEIADAPANPITSTGDIAATATPCVNTSTAGSTQPAPKVQRIKYHRNLQLPKPPSSKGDRKGLSFPSNFGLGEDGFGNTLADPSDWPVENVNDFRTQPYNIQRLDNCMGGPVSMSIDAGNNHVNSNIANKENVDPNELMGGVHVAGNHQYTNLDKSFLKQPQDHVIINLADPQLAGNGGDFQPENHDESRLQLSRNKARVDPVDRIDLSQYGSPEVQITGERIFRKECNSLVDQANNIYENFQNSSSVGFDSASSSGHNKMTYYPKRHVAPSHFKLSPYDDARLRSQVYPHFLKYHAIIVKLSQDESVKYNIAIDLKNIRVTIFSLGESFKFRGRVDFFTMNAWCRKLGLDAPPSRSKKNFFFSTLGDYILCNWNCEQQSIDLENTVLNVFDKIGSFITQCNFVFVPCLFRVHWFVFVVDFPGECFIILDSYFKEGTEYHKYTRHHILQNFSKVWNELTRSNIDFSKFRFQHPIVPMQNNEDDCGIFCMKFMQFFNPRSHLKDKFSFRDINNFRVNILHDMLFSRHNLNYQVRNMVTDLAEPSEAEPSE